MDDISWVGVPVGALALFVLAAVWYTALFGKAYRQELGVSEPGEGEAPKAPPLKELGGQFVAGLVITVALAWLIGQSTAWHGTKVGLAGADAAGRSSGCDPHRGNGAGPALRSACGGPGPDPFHLRLAQVALEAAARYGFCLAGGYNVLGDAVDEAVRLHRGLIRTGTDGPTTQSARRSGACIEAHAAGQVVLVP